MVTLESILKEYFLHREDGGVFFDVKKESDLIHFERFLEERNQNNKNARVSDNKSITENQNAILSELRIHFDVGNDSTLSIKDTFVSAFRMLQKMNANVIMSENIPQTGDKIHRQSNNKTDRPIRVLISSTSLKMMKSDDVGDSLWYVDNVPDIAFYISFNVDVSKLLKRTSHKGKAATTATESLHECFFAIALAYAIEERLDTYTNCKTLQNLIDILFGQINIIIKDRELIKQEFLTYISEDTTTDLTKNPSVYKLYIDAAKCAGRTYEKMKSLYNKGDKYNYVARVFATGKKTKADVLVQVKNDVVSISLKYGPGQFGNLSVNKLLQGLFGYQSEEAFLKSLYMFDKDSVNETFRVFLKYVNTFVDSQLKYGNLSPQHKKYYSTEIQKFYIIANGADYLRDFFDKTQKQRRDWYAGQFELALKHTNSNAELSRLKSAYDSVRKNRFNETIDKMITSKSNDQLKNIIDTLGYMLGSEESTSYIYVAKSGTQIHLIPSIRSLEIHRNEIEIKTIGRTESTNYEKKIQILLKNKPSMEMNISIRFKFGQWATDLGNSLTDFKVYDVNWD